MANALINFVVNEEKIPGRILDTMIGLGLYRALRWQFLIVMNVFLLVLGMVMDGFSAILVAVPLILPFAARFNLQPFHLAIMFLLNLEIAYCAPPLGLNLFISSFRFEKPVISLYRAVLPFTGILAIGLLLVMYIPKISTLPVEADIRAAYAAAAKSKEAPRDAWLLQCVQEDRSNPVPCTDEDRARFGPDGTKNPYAPVPEAVAPAPSATVEDRDGQADERRPPEGHARRHERQAERERGAVGRAEREAEERSGNERRPVEGHAEVAALARSLQVGRHAGTEDDQACTKGSGTG